MIAWQAVLGRMLLNKVAGLLSNKLTAKHSTPPTTNNTETPYPLTTRQVRAAATERADLWFVCEQWSKPHYITCNPHLDAPARQWTCYERTSEQPLQHRVIWIASWIATEQDKLRWRIGTDDDYTAITPVFRYQTRD